MNTQQDMLTIGLRDRLATVEGERDALREAIKPLADIADEYDKDGLDECRPYWVKHGTEKYVSEKELYCGRGGKSLITLGDAIRAREVLSGKPFKAPVTDVRVVKARKIFEQLYMSGPSWDEMSEERREQYIEQVAGLEL